MRAPNGGRLNAATTKGAIRCVNQGCPQSLARQGSFWVRIASRLAQGKGADSRGLSRVRRGARVGAGLETDSDS
jgi:hypothetical protein